MSHRLGVRLWAACLSLSLLLLGLGSAVGGGVGAFAQDGEPPPPEEEPAPEEEAAPGEEPVPVGAFLAGGGPLVQALFLDLSDLEASLPGVSFQGDLPFGDGSVYLATGGSGFAGEALRFGGMGVQGRWTAPVADETFDRAELTLEYGGFLLESLLASRGGLHLFVGSVLGNGRWGLTLSRKTSGAFADVVQTPTTVALSRGFLTLQPYVDAEWKLLEFVGLRLQLGALWTLSLENWALGDGTPVPQGPWKATFTPVLNLMVAFGG